jgi:hypothetical protein
LPPPNGDQPARDMHSYSSPAQIAEDRRRASESLPNCLNSLPKFLRFPGSISSSQKETQTHSFSTPNEGTTSKNTLENKDLFSESNKPREITSTICINGDPASAQTPNFEIAPQSPAPHTIANLSNGSQEPGCISSDLSADARNESLCSTADNQVYTILILSPAYGLSN